MVTVGIEDLCDFRYCPLHIVSSVCSSHKALIAIKKSFDCFLCTCCKVTLPVIGLLPDLEMCKHGCQTEQRTYQSKYWVTMKGNNAWDLQKSLVPKFLDICNMLCIGKLPQTVER